MSIGTWQQCALCSGTGWRVKAKQGDPVPDTPGVTYGSTVYETCPCRVYVPQMFPGKGDR